MEPPLTDTSQKRSPHLHSQYLRILPSADTSLFHEADKFVSPSSTWLVQNSLDNADAGMPLAHDCPAQLIDSTTGHYNSIGTRRTSIWLAFLASIQQRRALERAFKAAQVHIAMPTENIPEASKIQTPLCSGHAA